LKASLGENLLSSIEGISNVFGNAVANWDGTIRGFFKSVAQGFGQMAKQIISDLIRILVYKAVLKLVGAFAGGFGGGGSTGDVGNFGGGNGLPGIDFGAGAAEGLGGLAGRAFGGLSEAVSGFGNGMRGMVAPQMSFAGMGGMMPSSSSVSNNNQSTFNINVSGGNNPRETAQSVTQAIRQLMRKQEEEMRRRK